MADLRTSALFSREATPLRLLGDEPSLFRFARRIAKRMLNGRTDEADDVAQVVVVSLIYKRHSVAPGKEKAWLNQAVSLEVRRRRRSLSRRLGLASRWAEICALETCSTPDSQPGLLERFEDAVSRLPDPQRTVVRLKAHGLQNKEIATRMNRSVDTVKRLVKRAYAWLRNEVDGSGEDNG